MFRIFAIPIECLLSPRLRITHISTSTSFPDPQLKARKPTDGPAAYSQQPDYPAAATAPFPNSEKRSICQTDRENRPRFAFRPCAVPTVKCLSQTHASNLCVNSQYQPPSKSHPNPSARSQCQIQPLQATRPSNSFANSSSANASSLKYLNAFMPSTSPSNIFFSALSIISAT